MEVSKPGQKESAKRLGLDVFGSNSDEEENADHSGKGLTER